MKNEKISMADIRHKATTKNSQVGNRQDQKSHQQINSFARKVGKNMDIAKHEMVSRFTKNNHISNQKNNQLSNNVNTQKMDIGPISHPLTKKIQSRTKQITSQSSKEIKDKAIAEVFQKISEKREQERESEKRRNRIVIIITTIISFIGICFLAIYFSLPAIAVSVANAKSGIEASYPNYCPDGYSRKGVAHFNNGEVIIDYHSKNSDDLFSIKQSKSSWDSSAVKNMVNKNSNGKFLTTEESGLTIFSYNSNAVWVNGGILYQIDSKAPLTISDIRQIALSL